jgi:glycosyltransferase involved in cell wall biosynthesis
VLTAQIMAGAAQGGAEVFFERLCVGLRNAGTGVVPVIRTDRARSARLRSAGLSPWSLPFGGPADILTPIGLRAILRRAKPQIAMAWMGRAAAAAPSGPWRLIGRLGGYYDLRRFRRCHYLVANTEHIAAWIIAQGAEPASVRTLPNFVPDLVGAVPASRAELGVPEGAPLILALGRLHEAKAFDTLIRALADLPATWCVIAGEGDQRARLVRLAEEVGVAARLRLPGWRQDTASLLAACDVFVCPSRREPLGNTVLEAWSAARPVVAAAATGPAALITPEVDGVLVPTDDAATLARELAGVLADPARGADLAAAGRRHYLARYAEPVVLAAWNDFFRAVA